MKVNNYQYVIPKKRILNILTSNKNTHQKLVNKKMIIIIIIKRIRLMFLKMAQYMKAIEMVTFVMVLVNKPGRMALNTKANGNKIKPTAKVNFDM